MTAKNVAILISGRGSNMRALVEACRSDDFPARIVGVLANKADAAGLAFAAEHGIATHVISHKEYDTREAFDTAMESVLDDWQADVVCLAGFMRILSDAFVTRWEGKMINIHPSLLPKHPGLDTHRRALEAGDTTHGCTVHFVVPEVDAGPVIVQRQVPVQADDTPDTLAARVLEQEHIAYRQALRKVCESL